jgi:DNA invertase Pin-like site-specific DNA recombinase
MPESALARRTARATRPRAAILTRAARGERLHAESQALLAEAARRGYRLVCDPISEEGGDWAGDDRAGLHRALRLVDAGAIDVLLVADLPRLGRSVSGLYRIVERLRVRHVTLVSLRESIDLSTSSGRAFVRVLSTVAEFETACVRDLTSAGLGAAAARGRAVGQAPYGLSWRRASDADAPADLVPVPDEIATLRRAIELHGELGKWDAVVYALATEGRSSRSGKPWQRNVLARATRNTRVASFL